MTDCCEDKSCAIEALKKRQSGTLKIVLGINAIMFVVVFVAGLIAANSICSALLWKHRSKDINMK